jgi:hypothetical protein
MSEFVNFYKGLSDNFNQLESYQPGAFYLTTDTERLYFANGANSILDLNQYVIFVPSVSELSNVKKPTEGDIYYCTNENVLCTYNGSGWIQININTDTKTTGLVAGSSTVEKDGETVIKLTLALTEKTESALDESSETYTTEWEIHASDIYDIIPEAKVEVEGKLAEGALTINTIGDGSLQPGDEDMEKKGVTIIPGNNLAFEDNNNGAFTLNAAEYTLSSEAGSTAIALADDGIDGVEDKTQVELLAGHQLAISGAEANKITYSHGTIETTETNGGAIEGGALWSNSVSYVQSVDTHKDENGNGHVFGYSMASITMPDEPEYEITKFVIGEGDDAGKLTVGIRDKSSTGSGYGNDVDATGALYYKIRNDNNVDEIYYNTQTLPVYTIEQIETRLKGLNAITYKGTVNPVSGLPSESVHVGDAYMATENGDYGNEGTVFLDDKGETVHGVLAHVEAGDLFIATGTEADGVITSGLVWTYVPAGNDYDSQYYLEHNANVVTLKGNTSSNPDMASFNGSVEFNVDNTQNDDILVTVSDDNADKGDTVVVKYGHKEYGEVFETPAEVPIETGYDQTISFTTIGELSNGHVSKAHNFSFITPPVQDVQLTSSATEPTISIKDSYNGAKGNVKFVNDTEDGTTIIEAVAVEAGQIKFKHRRNLGTKKTGNSTPLNWSENYNWIQNVVTTEEGDGHVKEFTTVNFTMPDDPSINKVELSRADASEHSVAVTQYISSPDGQSPDIYSKVNFKTETDSLILATTLDSNTKNNNEVSVKVDLVWKSF